MIICEDKKTRFQSLCSVTGWCEHANEHPVAIKVENFFFTCWETTNFLKKYSAAGNLRSGRSFSPVPCPQRTLPSVSTSYKRTMQRNINNQNVHDNSWMWWQTSGGRGSLLNRWVQGNLCSFFPWPIFSVLRLQYSTRVTNAKSVG